MDGRAQDGLSGPAATADEGILSRMGLNDNKAGMEGLDREKINKIILESSKVWICCLRSWLPSMVAK